MTPENRPRLKQIFILLRPHHYIKNLIVLAPLFFSQKLLESRLLFYSLAACVSFCMAASSAYILNDFKDIEFDRLHSEKKKRPLAANTVSTKTAKMAMATCSLVAITIAASISLECLLVLVTYLLLNIAYSLGLKHFAIIDCTLIAFFFLLRLVMGSAAVSVSLSNWIVVMTFLLAFFIALAKRRSDVVIYLHSANKTRRSIDGYNLPFLDTAMPLMASVVIVAYSMYTTSREVMLKTGKDYLYVTALFVVMGILRFLQRVYVYRDTSSPTNMLLKDHFLQFIIICWLCTFAFILYF